VEPGAFSIPPYHRHGNRGGYAGERIDVESFLREIVTVAAACRWDLERLEAGPGLELLALTRRVPHASRCVYISTGIHGDEPAGPLAALELLKQNRWPEHAEVRMVPCLNPTGLAVNHRENAAGRDLNRDYRAPSTPEVRAHVGWLAGQPQFDCTYCLHEDWEAQGFYLYELNPDGQPSQAGAIVEAVSKVCPIDNAEVIDGWPALSGIIRPEFRPAERLDWPEAFYLVETKTRHSYTLEAPSDFSLEVRVAALVTAVQSALRP
jgi:murein peptide amidase A